MNEFVNLEFVQLTSSVFFSVLLSLFSLIPLLCSALVVSTL